MAKRHGEEWSQPASVEALTLPWLIIKHRATDDIEEGYVIYMTTKMEIRQKNSYI